MLSKNFFSGGPGSAKGTIINNLRLMYGVHLVCCEDILLTKLYEKVFKPEEESSDADAGTRMNENATKEMSRFLMENPDEATRSWLFKLLEEEVSKIIDNNGEGAVILIDMVPNLKFLLKASAFKDDPSNKDIEKFETKVIDLIFRSGHHLLFQNNC